MNSKLVYDITFFICPLSKKIYLNPVLASDGYFYEYELISSWLATNNKSPTTSQPITNTLIPATKIKCMINHFLELNPSCTNQQYTKDYSYINNRLFIMTYIKSNNFYKLLQYKDIILTDKLYDNTPLIKILSQYCTDYSTMVYIIDNCVDLDVHDDDGYRPIQYICMYSPANIIQYAINKMEINFEIYNGSCPILSYLDGISYNNKQLLHELITKTDNINQLSITGKNILDYLMYINFDLDTLKLLYNKGFIVDQNSYALQSISSNNMEYYNYFTEIGWLPTISKITNSLDSADSADSVDSADSADSADSVDSADETDSLDETDETDNKNDDDIQQQIINDFYNLIKEEKEKGNNNSDMILNILSNILKMPKN